jgi:hypothetical protein
VNRVSGLDRSSFHGPLCWVGVGCRSRARVDVRQVGGGEGGVCLVTLFETRNVGERSVVLLDAFCGVMRRVPGFVGVVTRRSRR